MDGPLQEEYLRWLHSQFIPPHLRAPTRTYKKLTKLLNSTEFIWLVHNDDNRCADGIRLRYEFLDSYGGLPPEDAAWLDYGCSFMEMLVAFSRLLAFETDISAGDWVKHMLDMMGLLAFNDRDYTREGAAYIQLRVDDIIWRRYAQSGEGGLFPLRFPQADQRQVELWYQASAYMIENNL